MRVLFWNEAKRLRSSLVAELAVEQRADVVVVAEFRKMRGNTVTQIAPEKLTSLRGETFQRLTSPDHDDMSRVTGFNEIYVCESTATGPLTIQWGTESHRYRFLQIGAAACGEMLFGVVHLPSKVSKSATSQAHLAGRLIRDVQVEEERFETSRTVLVGDFNFDPFEPGMISSEMLHAVPDRRVSARKTRQVSRESRAFFYNPCWRFLGDFPSDTPGTYYHGQGEVTPFWHTFDQVLIRPSLQPQFVDESLKIVTQLNGRSLLQPNGRPNKDDFSDHLPIVFEFRPTQ